MLTYLSFIYSFIFFLFCIAFRRETHESIFYKQREDLQDWEKKLQKREELLCELRKTLNLREEKANVNDSNLRQKEKDLEELEKKIDVSRSKVKEREDDISSRLEHVVEKERVGFFTGCAV